MQSCNQLSSHISSRVGQPCLSRSGGGHFVLVIPGSNRPVAETGPVTLLNPIFICMKSRELTHLHPHVLGRFEPNSQDVNLAGSRHQPATRSAPAVPECSTCLENVVNVPDIPSLCIL